MTYLKCPVKLAFKTLGIRTRRGASIGKPRFDIGMEGEEIVSLILKLISEEKSKAPRLETEAMFELPETVEEEIGTKTLDEIEEICEEATRVRYFHLEEVLEGLRRLMPDIEEYWHHITLKGARLLARGQADFLVRTRSGLFVVEVRNVGRISEAEVAKAILHAKFYNSLLRDGLAKIRGGNQDLPKTTYSVVVFPRQGIVRKVDGYLQNFDGICRTIWGVKRLALTEGKVPEVKVPKATCRYCHYKKFCAKFERDSVPEAKPLPVVCAVAERECGADRIAEIAEARAKILEISDFNERVKLERLLKFAERDLYIKSLYRAMPEEFEEWGGLPTLTIDLERIRTNMYFFELQKDEILKPVRREWRL